MMRSRSSSVKGGDATAPGSSSANVLFDVWLVSRATMSVLESALGPTGLSADEFGLYSVLRSSDGSTPSDLARWMAAPLTTVSSYVKRLESRGHVARERNPNDGRSLVLRLTPAGVDAHAAAGRAFEQVLRRVESGLGSREPGVRRALAQLRAALEAAP